MFVFYIPDLFVFMGRINKYTVVLENVHWHEATPCGPRDLPGFSGIILTLLFFWRFPRLISELVGFIF